MSRPIIPLPTEPIDWSQSNSTLAKRYNVSNSTAKKWRRQAKQPPIPMGKKAIPLSSGPIDWSQPNKVIAEANGVSYLTARKWRREANQPARRAGRSPMDAAEFFQKHSHIIRAAENKKQHEIAQEIGSSRQNVNAILCQYRRLQQVAAR